MSDNIANALLVADEIETELNRLKAQAKGLERKILETEARYQGAKAVCDALKPSARNPEKKDTP